MTTTQLPTHAYLNDINFIKVIENNYKVKRIDSCDLFLVNPIFGTKKVTTFPHSFSRNYSHEKLESEFTSGINEAKKLAAYFEYKGYREPSKEFQKQHDINSITLGITNLIPLSNSETLIANFNSRHRSKILKCQRDHGQELEHKIANEISEFKEWYDLLIYQYQHKHRMVCQPYSLLKDLFALGCSKLWIQRYKGKIVGGVFILHDQTSYDYSWGAFDSAAAPKNAGALLLYRTMIDAIENSITLYNLGASSASDSDLRFFKSRWGGSEQPIYLACWNHESKAVDLDSDYKLIRNMIPYIPRSIFKQLCKLAVPQLI